MRIMTQRLSVLTALAALVLTLGLSPAKAAGDVVISQVSGGGGSANTIYKNDFVELYNRTATEITLTGWSLQYASATGNFNGKLNLNGTIAPGKYFLIQLGGGTTGADLPTPDQTGSLNLSATNGKVALVSDTTLLGTNTSPTGPTIIDYVGYGSANLYEGTAAVPVLSSTTAALRNGDPRGTVDTDDNAADFTVGAPDPRNSTYGGVSGPSVSNVSFNPASVDAGGNSTLTATVTPGANPTITSVTADLTPIGGSATAPLTLSGDVYTATVTVAAGTSAGGKSITVTATDAASLTGTGSATLTVNPSGVLTVAQARLVTDPNAVNAVRGIVTASSTGNIYIADADGSAGILTFDGSPSSGVVGTLSDSTTRAVVVGDELIVTGRIYEYRGEMELDASAGAPASIVINSTGNTVPTPTVVTVAQATESDTYEGRLITLNNVTAVTKPTGVSSTSNTPHSFIVQDSAGNQIQVSIYRNATTRYNTPPGPVANPITASEDPENPGYYILPDIVIGNIYNISGPLGEYNTNTPPKQIKPRDANDLVFVGVGLITGATANPTNVERGGYTTLTVTTNPVSGPVATADLSAFGGSSTQSLTFNGWDAYTYDLYIPANQPLGPTAIPIKVTYGADEATTTINVSIYSADVITIAEARALADNTQTTVSGVITSKRSGAAKCYYLQDETAGIYLYTTGADAALVEGDAVTVTGVKKTYNGQVELVYTNVSTPGTGTVPDPIAITAAQWSANPGKLATTTSLLITGTRSAGNNTVFQVTDGTATGEIFISSLALVANGGDITPENIASMTIGSAWDVTGPVDSFLSGTTLVWQIKPRRWSDIVPGTPPAGVKGDVDKSTTVTNADVVLALRVAAGIVSASDPTVSLNNGDVAPATVDGQLTILDAARILRSLNGLDTL